PPGPARETPPGPTTPSRPSPTWPSPDRALGGPLPQLPRPPSAPDLEATSGAHAARREPRRAPLNRWTAGRERSGGSFPGLRADGGPAKVRDRAVTWPARCGDVAARSGSPKAAAGGRQRIQGTEGRGSEWRADAAPPAAGGA